MIRIDLAGLFMPFPIFKDSGQRNCGTMGNLEKQLLLSPRIGDKIEIHGLRPMMLKYNFAWHLSITMAIL